MCCNDKVSIEVNWKYEYKPASIRNSDITGTLPIP